MVAGTATSENMTVQNIPPVLRLTSVTIDPEGWDTGVIDLDVKGTAGLTTEATPTEVEFIIYDGDDTVADSLSSTDNTVTVQAHSDGVLNGTVSINNIALSGESLKFGLQETDSNGNIARSGNTYSDMVLPRMTVP